MWDFTWLLFCKWTPKPFNPWRLFILRLFGARLHGVPFVHQRARIDHPWKLSMYHRACLGDRAHAYCLDYVCIHAHATVAQEAYLCTGTHDFESLSMPLITAPILLKDRCFIGARAFLLPGVTVGESSVVGACSLVSRSVPAHSVFAGNPARSIKTVATAI